MNRRRTFAQARELKRGGPAKLMPTDLLAELARATADQADTDTYEGDTR